MKRILNKETTRLIGQKVKVSGWVHVRRDHGKIVFIDLRDRSGVLQIVFLPKAGEVYNLAQKLRSEWVVSVEGEIKERPKGMINPKIETGKVEMEAQSLEVLSESETLPFSIEGKGYEIGEEIRLKYRYLDLRRERMKKNLILRQKVINCIRDFLNKEDFLEVETPVLTKSTPEGARDFVVPSRLHPGKFFALPQSPQQYKQLLMIGGIEKYFQIPRCFRDEDPRADRQAEFTQLDIEMSFIDQEEILDLTEKLYIEIIKKTVPEKRISQIPFPRLKYEDVMKKYKTDKPDLRKDKSNPDELAFAFVVDFPMFEWKKEEKRWGAVHHPFTRPKTEDLKKIKENPKNILAYQYDFILNGCEIGGGSLRTYKPEILETVFEVLGHKKKEIKNQFGHLLEAFRYGVPPHGGIAPGIDRLVMILAGEENIREVMAFPKTGDSRDPLMDSPSEISEAQLKELRLKTVKRKK
ncbi:MAG: aspartate--tRNA ligase [Candidatus Nealsonbacteria bacterium]